MYDLSDNIFAEFGPGCTAGCWIAGAVYLNGQFFAEYYNNTTYFVHADHLGSSRLLTALDQSTCDNLDYLPFGEQLSGGSCTNLRFTGQERDSESGLDNFIARYNSSSMGRFMSPDPENAGASEGDPQSWNGYAYVINDPLNSIDPSGLVTCKVDGVEYNCGLALHSVQLGTAAVCPNNNCTTWRFTTNVSGQDVFLNTAPFGTVWHPYPAEDNFTSSGNSVSGIFSFQGAQPIDQSLSIIGMQMLAIASNFSAGAGDCLTGRCIPFVDHSLTEWARGSADSVVNKNSWSYTGGEITGGAVATGILSGGVAAGVAKRGWLNRGQYFRIGWSRLGGNRVFRVGGKVIQWLFNRKALDIYKGGPL